MEIPVSRSSDRFTVVGYDLQSKKRRSNLLMRTNEQRRKQRGYMQTYREKYPERIRESKRKYLQTEKGKESVARIKKKYAQTHREQYRKTGREWKKRNPEKVRVHNLCRKFPLASKCDFCSNESILQKHHPDYTIPELFVTCCSECHTWLDMERGVYE